MTWHLNDMYGDDFVALGSTRGQKVLRIIFDKAKDLAVFEMAEEMSPHLLVLLDDGERVEEEHEKASDQVFGQVVVLGLLFLWKVS